VTSVAAIVFMVTSLTLSIFAQGGSKKGSVVVADEPAAAAPAEGRAVSEEAIQTPVAPAGGQADMATTDGAAPAADAAATADGDGTGEAVPAGDAAAGEAAPADASDGAAPAADAATAEGAGTGEAAPADAAGGD
jgi:hypothetical protein